MAATSSVPGARFVDLDNGLADFPQIYDVPLTVRRVAINLQVRLPDARRRSGGPLERAPGRFALGYAFGRPDKVRRCRGFVATCFLSAYRVAVSRSGACARGRVAGRAGSLRAEGPQGRGNHPADLRPSVRWSQRSEARRDRLAALYATRRRSDEHHHSRRTQAREAGLGCLSSFRPRRQCLTPRCSSLGEGARGLRDHRPPMACRGDFRAGRWPRRSSSAATKRSGTGVRSPTNSATRRSPSGRAATCPRRVRPAAHVPAGAVAGPRRASVPLTR